MLPASQVPFFRRTIGVVFQDFKLIARKSVFENIAFVQNVLGLPRAEQRRRDLPGLEARGVASPDERLPAVTSPAASSSAWRSPARSSTSRRFFRRRADGQPRPGAGGGDHAALRGHQHPGTTIVVATHDLDLIRRMGKRVLTLERGTAARGRPARAL